MGSFQPPKHSPSALRLEVGHGDLLLIPRWDTLVLVKGTGEGPAALSITSATIHHHIVPRGGHSTTLKAAPTAQCHVLLWILPYLSQSLQLGGVTVALRLLEGSQGPSGTILPPRTTLWRMLQLHVYHILWAQFLTEAACMAAVQHQHIGFPGQHI